MASRRLGMILFGLAAWPAFPQTPQPDARVKAWPRGTQWMVVLDAPAYAARSSPDTQGGVDVQQANFTNAVRAHGGVVMGGARNLLNAVFLDASSIDEATLRSQPGVASVLRLPPAKRLLNKALDLVNVSGAWSVVGGQANAGAGVKIGILDTGIDHSHPAMRDPSLGTPAGFPKGSAQDLPYTTNKIIVARSYVGALALGDGTPEDSRPDDLTPRDRVGHGTAVAAIAAAAPVTAPAASISGVAPKAWLGNYKIFGSPGVNDVTFASVVAAALDDAFRDGMDVVALPLAFPAEWRTADAVCGSQGKSLCDPWAAMIDNAARGGMTVVVAAGNDGDAGIQLPALNSVATPGIASAAITVGATTNSHLFFSSVYPQGGDIPKELQAIDARMGDGPALLAPLKAPLVDVTSLNDDGKACYPLGNNTLSGAIALILRGDCDFQTKITYAQNAGALAVIIYREAGADFPFPPVGLLGTGIPAALIGNTNGNGLKALIKARGGLTVTLDPSLVEITGYVPDEIAYFSSQGPSINDGEIKPDLAAPGTGMYTATQSYDPNGDLFDATGYTAAQGTSFAVPLVAGAVALTKQRNPSLTPAQLKSAVVNTAGGQLTDYDYQGKPIQARVTAAGAGKLNAAAAVSVNLAATPVSVSFGYLSGPLPSRNVRLTNTGTSSLNLSISVQQRDPDSRARVSVSPAALNLAAGQSQDVTVSLQGSTPLAGSYEGFLSVSGAASPFRIPYLYIVGDGVPFNAFPLSGGNWTQAAGYRVPVSMKVVDRYGAPVPNLRVQFRPAGLVDQATPGTDMLGIAAAFLYAGPNIGPQYFAADVAGATVYFDGVTVPQPAILTGGVVNSASGLAGPAAPGSLITIRGFGLSPASRDFVTPYMPLSLAGVSVSFDVPDLGISVPGRIAFVSDSQVGVQTPWELAGASSVLVKISTGGTGVLQTGLYNLPLNDYAAALFESLDSGTGRLAVYALDESGNRVSAANPAARGRIVRLFANGLGPVSNQPASGDPSPAQPAAETRVKPSVTIGGQPADVSFSGLSPGTVALYEVDVVIPSTASAGQQDVVLAINGQTARTSSITVK